VATALCPHGFAPDACLICRTLSIGTPARGAGSVEVLTDGRRPARRSLGLGTRALGGLALVAGALLVVWWLTAVIWAVLRVVELVAAAAVAGYLGWKLGVRHGRRHPG
jgi:hypothetical protein